jgi:hypothetical protein
MHVRTGSNECGDMDPDWELGRQGSLSFGLPRIQFVDQCRLKASGGQSQRRLPTRKSELP